MIFIRIGYKFEITDMQHVFSLSMYGEYRCIMLGVNGMYCINKQIIILFR